MKKIHHQSLFPLMTKNKKKTPLQNSMGTLLKSILTDLSNKILSSIKIRVLTLAALSIRRTQAKRVSFKSIVIIPLISKRAY